MGGYIILVNCVRRRKRGIKPTIQNMVTDIIGIGNARHWFGIFVLFNGQILFHSDPVADAWERREQNDDYMGIAGSISGYRQCF